MDWAEFARQQGFEGVIADPYKICYELGIDVVYRDTDNDGYLICSNGCKIIIISNRISNKHRRRFIVSHELGHFLLHGESMYCCKNLYDTNSDRLNSINQEQQANAFASELLLPKIKLKEYLPDGLIKFSNISRLADAFNVSMTMCARKAIQLSKMGSEILLVYNGDRLSWYSTSNPELSDINIFKSKYQRLSNLYCHIGSVIKWRSGMTSQNMDVEEFIPYDNQKLILIPNVKNIL